ncbi:MAG: NAD(P)-dependent oxidoreductase [Gallionella sp.]|nr:NAD(P)-dependent oxidoreductase [Gallionella sp.]MDD4946160.1 NAD(P)-dependent oxidoreductase [Gallionella sp.]
MSEINKLQAKKPVALVTGATGFVGGHLATRLLKDGWDVHILIRNGSVLPEQPEFGRMACHVHDGSTESMIACLANAKPDIVFHLASLFLSQHASKDIDALIRSNVQFATQLLEAMNANLCTRLVNTGTSWQHYNNEDYNPVCLYAATKQAFEAILEYYVQACSFKAITLKLFDTYGPGDLRPKLFHLLNKAAASGEALDMSAGEQFIDLVHIDDVMEAFLIAAQRLLDGKVPVSESYAVSSGQPLPLKDLVALYAEVSGQTIRVNWGARPYRYREVMAPWNRGASLPGWKPQISLSEGMKSLKNH